MAGPYPGERAQIWVYLICAMSTYSNGAVAAAQIRVCFTSLRITKFTPDLRERMSLPS